MIGGNNDGIFGRLMRLIERPDLADDPHYAARAMHEQRTVNIDDQHSTEISVTGIVPKLSNTPGNTRWLGPELGHHTAEVLTGIGIEESEQDALRAAGVI
ncbi:hypothetical protein [Bounagaea algeriensis]